MKNVHYIHFGMPRSGTSWIFNNLSMHPQVDYIGIKEDPYLVETGLPLSAYKTRYNRFSVSFNFNPFNWAIDSKQLKELDTITTHAGISFRNPFTTLDSWHNFTYNNNHRRDYFVREQIELNLVNYKKILNRLTTLTNLTVKVFLYDDLVERPQWLYNSLTDYLGLENQTIITESAMNSSHRHNVLPFTKEEIITINAYIDEFSELIGRDMSKWKR